MRLDPFVVILYLSIFSNRTKITTHFISILNFFLNNFFRIFQRKTFRTIATQSIENREQKKFNFDFFSCPFYFTPGDVTTLSSNPRINDDSVSVGYLYSKRPPADDHHTSSTIIECFSLFAQT